MARVPVLADHDEPLADQAADRVVARAVRRELAAAPGRDQGARCDRAAPPLIVLYGPTAQCQAVLPGFCGAHSMAVRVVRAVCEIGSPPQLQVSRTRAADRVLCFVETYGLLHPRPRPAAMLPCRAELPGRLWRIAATA
ncbi:hypothetical protein AB0L50_15430 [Streptomyces flaveolus]|uniref:hypothetical protein n=1 Tax=Streptomyces flaveolus TaxID=67297 RepID=UPI0034257EB2